MKLNSSLALLSLFAFASLAQAAPAPERAGKAASSREPGCTYYEYLITSVGAATAREDGYTHYNFIVQNTGNCTLRDLKFSDLLPFKTSFFPLGSNPQPAEVDGDGRKLKWFAPAPLRPGDYYAFEVIARVSDHIRNPIVVTNTPCAFSPQIGVRICAPTSTTIYENEHHPLE